MTRPRTIAGATGLAMIAVVACTPARYVPPKDPDPLAMVHSGEWPSRDATVTSDARQPAEPTEVLPAPAPVGPLRLDAVLSSVVERYPPYLAKLLQRDLASGRLTQALGGFDTNATAKVGGQLQGFYESTVGEAMIEQPLASGDTLYGGYRISDGFLPDYYNLKGRTQDDGEFVVGGRFPLLQNREIDGRRADVRIAEIGVLLAEPEILRARIKFVQFATIAYHKWTATGTKLQIARELLQLALDRQEGLQRAVDRQFLAPIEVTDNERLIAKRKVYVARATRAFQAAALKLSLYLRDDLDRPIVATTDNLPETGAPEPPVVPGTHREDLLTAAGNRPELRELQLAIEQAETERDLADNRTLPQLDVIVEAASSPVEAPYKDIEGFELFVGGEFKMPFQRRKAFGKLQQAEAKWNKLRLEQKFLRDRITNELLDVRSAMIAARDQFEQSSRNVGLAVQMVAAEQRKFDLGLSDLLRVQLREVQLADARMELVEARLAFDVALASYRAALGHAAEP